MADLTVARDRALKWWSGLITKEETTSGETKAHAEQRVRQRWPFGPTLHPYVLAVYRQYYIECERLNNKLYPRLPPIANASPVSEEDWGVPDDSEPVTTDRADRDPEDAFWASMGPCDPPVLLFDVLHERHEALGEFMAWLVFAPIGSENDISV
ncbi:hypothetical protein [Caballeronia arationis]|uniref:hypothetical protein n=1 Tax=Caballeronia arationis TaxID=1777142 RepID=UPI00117E3BCD|nr:hypothetical protein [Caballeronia arationis]